MTGLTPDQLQEIINMMEDQLNINYTAGSGGGFDFIFPDGYNGDPVIQLTGAGNTYEVPELIYKIFDSENSYFQWVKKSIN